jgi:hypothetical protein
MPVTNIKSEWRGGVLHHFDVATQETTVSASAFQFSDDFIDAGAGIPAAGSPATGYAWVKKITGAAPPTLGQVANAAAGALAAALTATSEAQESSLYFNDSLGVDVSKIGQAEWRAALSVAPSAAGVQAFLGIGSAWVVGPQNLARYAGFGWTANGNLLIWSKDGTNTYSIAAAQIGGAAIVSDTNQHIFRIDWTNTPTDLAFYYDGNRVNTVGSITWAGVGANAILQPFATVYKPSGTGVATLTIDKIDIFNTR